MAIQLQAHDYVAIQAPDTILMREYVMCLSCFLPSSPAISPAESSYGETLSMLRYASRAKNKPTVNEVMLCSY